MRDRGYMKTGLYENWFILGLGYLWTGLNETGSMRTGYLGYMRTGLYENWLYDDWVICGLGYMMTAYEKWAIRGLGYMRVALFSRWDWVISHWDWGISQLGLSYPEVRTRVMRIAL
jgi:hypothetical protein